MRYAPPGLCVNDFDLLRHADGTYTALHLQGPWTAEFDHLRMETSYGRATSADLVHWEPQGTAFGNGLPGSFDQQAVWTMHAFPHGTGMAMLYTAVSGLTPDGWPLQSVGLAYSDRTDGTGWRRHGTGPVVEADGRWYRTGDRMGWRDPFVVRDDESDGWVMVVCAADASLPVEVSGCVAWATSDDLEHWTVHPPLVSPGDVDEFECPVLERLDDGGWLLLGSIGATRGFEAWTAPRLRGPWTRRGPLGPTGAYAPRVVTAPDGSRVVLHTTPRRVGLSDTGERCRGMLAQPKSLVVPSDSAPRLEWWPGLEPWLGEETYEAVLHAVGDVGLSGRTEIVLRTQASDADRPALTVDCDGKDLRVTGPDGTSLGETCLPEPAASLRILTVGEYVEVYADGVFVLTTLCYSGRPAPWTATAEGGARPVPVRPLRLPDPHRDDASAVWPGPPPQ
ncbi:mucin-1 [Streptomyces violaceochromogenes]|uniref:beta-fructofuranosidase n=1 Tax=Streptomyces violaceochromogenes TaxID=67377 RepID=A0ABU6LYV6_9ACTN|nr:mucin-1 [Streptomyces violaceochromogenes]MEC7054711.1 mucin-1 [Streptomyces violaceochromogenes]GHC76882.1 invertase [Streptomyces violaceochromogenes]